MIKKYLRLFKIGRLFHTPSLLYSKYLYNQGQCWMLNSQFKLFEDNPSWYSMFKYVDDLKINFSSDILVLYRISERSISNRTTVDDISRNFQEELKKLYRIYYNEGDLFDKLYFGLIISNIGKYVSWIVKKYEELVAFFYCMLHKKKFNEFENDLKEQLEKEKKYYQYIKETSIDEEKHIETIIDWSV